MKKIGIITINDNDNYGNRLQNYAVFKVLKSMDYDVETIKNTVFLNRNTTIFEAFLRCCYYKFILEKDSVNKKRKDSFFRFNQNIKFSRYIFSSMKQRKLAKYDFIIVGSDQVWNPYFGRLQSLDLLDFKKIKNKISFSASFGIDELPTKIDNKYLALKLEEFSFLSVRENKGRDIIENLTGRKDVEVLVDPTMLLNADEWDVVSRKPKQLNFDKYVLNYFLGELSDDRRIQIERFAKKHNCKIINILDKNDPFYETGPSEFLYLEKHSFLICTDSFHSSVFSILYNRPFIVFDREDDNKSMGSRIDTLLSKFKLEDRRYTGSITDESLIHDYKNAYQILKEERKKSFQFLNKALDYD